MGPGELIWDFNFVEGWAIIMKQLNEDVKIAEDDTKTINRRQEQLGITRCDFPELLRLKEDVKPAV